MEEKIASCAKRILELLEQGEILNILRLAERLEERNVISYQALGWLARDGKVHYEQKGSQVFISCNTGEAKVSPDNEVLRRNS